MTNYLIILKLGKGSFEQGFPVTLQMGEEGSQPILEMTGKLPSAAEIPVSYSRWQASYRRLGHSSRLEPKTGFISNVSTIENCDRAAVSFHNCFNNWLNSESFRPIREKLLEKLKPSDEIRILLQTENPQLQRLPWHLWDWFDRYPKAEIALSSPIYERREGQPSPPKNKLRILAVVGDSTGIDTQSDRALLDHLPQAETTFLVEPDRQTLTECLWEQKGWDLLFFAGHSTTHPDGTTGRIYLNPIDSLTIPQLKYALKQAVDRGLKIAIFNSCDGLGLAYQLSDLQIPQVLVMREAVPDKVAQEFLKYFLAAFARGKSFYLAVREAREKLQGLENNFPCATWLPVICQNPAEIPITWHKSDTSTQGNWRILLLGSLAIAALTIGIRYLGLLQPMELAAFDQLMRHRAEEVPDSRLLIVTVTEEDVQRQNPEQRRGSLSDTAFDRLLQKLQPHKPRAIGLDIYRDFAVGSGQEKLAKQLRGSDNLIAICKVSDRTVDDPGIAPPPEIPLERLGFSDFVVDSDGRVRRQLLALTPESASPCQASYAFSLQLAFRYLAAEGIFPSWTTEGYLQLGKTVLKTLQTQTGVDRKIDTWGHQILLNYRCCDRIADRVTLTDILEDKVNPKSIEGRIVLIGTTARSFADYWSTPYSQSQSQEQQIPGVFLQAQMTSQILSAVLDRRPLLWVLPQWGEFLWIWVWSFVGGIVVWRSHLSSHSNQVLKLAGALLSAQIGLYGCCFLVLAQTGGWLPLIPSSLALVATSTGAIAWRIRQQKGELYAISEHKKPSSLVAD
jgi:CHASE2 domain-containing sensor protein